MFVEDLLQLSVPWITEQFSHLDSGMDVKDLVDYTITCLKDCSNDTEVRNSCQADLSEFLFNDTQAFAEGLLNEMRRQSALVESGQVQPPPQTSTQTNTQTSTQSLQTQQSQPVGSQSTTPSAFATSQGPPQAQGQELPPLPQFPSLPNMPSFNDVGKMFKQMQQMSQQMQGRGGFNNDRGGNRGGRRGGRANNGYSQVSSIDNTMGRMNTRLIVEKVPEANMNEESILGHFSKFGQITNLRLEPSQQLAEIEFSTHEQAQAAHSSPDTIFDNRFVKVYWRKDDGGYNYHSQKARQQQQPQQPKEEMTLEKLQQIQAERHQMLQEKQARRQQYNEKLAELVSARKQLAAQQESLVAATTQLAGQADITSQLATIQEGQKQLEEFKQQIDALKAQAVEEGLTSAPVPAGGRGGRVLRGARGYRGGAASGRGASATPYGRGGSRGAPVRGAGRFANVSLDRRPKSVVVSGANAENEQALLTQLASTPFVNIERQDDQTVIVDFADRRTAEAFFGARSDLPELSQVKKQFIRHDPPQEQARNQNDESMAQENEVQQA